MKIFVLGLDSASPETVFADERWVNVRRVMEAGLYGELEAGDRSTSASAWISMCTSQDFSDAGIDTAANKGDDSNDQAGLANSDSTRAWAIWDQLEREGRKSIIVGVPPDDPSRRLNGISIGSFLSPAPKQNGFTYVASMQTKLRELVGEYPMDVKNLPDRIDLPRDQIFEMSRKQWNVVRWLMREQEWDYFQFVDSGLDRVQRGCSSSPDPQHVRFEQENRSANDVSDYCSWLDEQVASVLELLDTDTLVLILSPVGPGVAEDETDVVQSKLSSPGFFILAAPNCPLTGEYVGARVVDIAPTLLDLAGHEIPRTFQGRSIVAGMEKRAPEMPSAEEERALHDRLAGLGYI